MSTMAERVDAPAASADDGADGTDRPRSVRRLLFQVLGVWCVITVIGLAVAWATITTSVVDGPSMEPTLFTGDTVVATRFGSADVGDIVTVDIVVEDGVRRPLVKRVVAVGGDVVSYEGCSLVRNGVVVDEPFVHPTAAAGQCGDPFADEIVPEGHVWLLGDHRARSTDSRRYGPVSVSDIDGVVWFTL